MSKKIYITGYVSGANTDQLNEFNLAIQELNDLGFDQVTSPVEVLIEGNMRGDKDAEQLFLKKREELRSAANTVLHLDKYEYDIDSIQEVKRSKAEGKEVYGCIEFIHKHSAAKIS